VIGVNIELVQMRDARLEDFDVSETHGNVLRQGDPQMAATLRVFQLFPTRSFREHRFWRVPGEKPGSGELHGRQQREVI
jgi:hypothetical protein